MDEITKEKAVSRLKKFGPINTTIQNLRYRLGLSSDEVDELIYDLYKDEVVSYYKCGYSFYYINAHTDLRLRDIKFILRKSGIELKKIKYKQKYIIVRSTKVPSYWDRNNIITKAIRGG